MHALLDEPTPNSGTMIASSKALACVLCVAGLLFGCTSMVEGNPTCDITVNLTACTNAGLRQSSFPNDFGHRSAADAESAFTTAFGFSDLDDSCSPDVALFACLLYFPECRVNNAIGDNIVRRPCRDFCERMQVDCADISALRNVSCDSFSFWNPASPTACYDPFHLIVINEIDVETNQDNALQFVELWDYGMGDTPLDNFVFIGSGTGSAADLTLPMAGLTSSNGYFVLGKEGLANADANIFKLFGGTRAIAIYRDFFSKYELAQYMQIYKM